MFREGVIAVGKVALAMFLDDNTIALAAYKAGDRTNAEVALYFDRFNLGRLAGRM
jgi:hypothetical protein